MILLYNVYSISGITFVVANITPIMPIFRSYLSMIKLFLYFPCIVGSSESSRLHIKTGELMVSRKGTTPSTLWSNSWLPMVCRNI